METTEEHSMEKAWRSKSDEQIAEAAVHLADYTQGGQNIIRAELKKRGMAEPTTAPNAEAAISADVAGDSMDQRKALALVGSGVLMIGVFMPVVSLPIVGTMTYFKNGEGDGTIVLALGAISLLLVLSNRMHLLAVTGLLSLGVLGFTFYQLQTRLAEMRVSMERELAGNPFAGLARGLMEGVQLQWGWALLVLGAGLVLAASVMRSAAQRVKCPYCAELIQADAKICKHCKREVGANSAEPARVDL